jgi:SAM-dependent methyltransferase
MNAPERWRDDLRAWAIPDEILAAAPESPYGFPSELFRRRAERSASTPATPTTRRAREALPRGATVLDVGVGGGSTSLPLADRTSLIVGVDSSASMLEAFRETAAAVGVRAETIEGTWPDIAPQTPACDLVVCGHVLYNVQDVVPFALALDDHARRRVVIELTGEHPLAWTNDLWLRFQGIERPTSPTAEDARAVLRGLGLEPGWEERTDVERSSGFERSEDAVALVRRRLCLSPDADREVAEALGSRLASADGLWSAGPAETRVVTMWWDAGDRQEVRRAT